MDNNQIIVYNDGEIELNVSIDDSNETIWLRGEEIALMFGVNRPAIVKHIGNIYKSDELNEKSTCSILEQLTKDGKKRQVKYYNLDMIISVGYRINSAKATKFRQWATQVLKSYIYDGYAINSKKITNERFVLLEKEVASLKSDFLGIKSKIQDNTLELKQGVFYNGEVFDAYKFINDLIKNATKSIILIDNYIDESVLTLFSKLPEIKVTIYTHTINKQLQLDIQKYQTQYNNVTLKSFKNSHDRFLIIDDTELYHIGASLKDLGKKWFAFSKMDIDNTNILQRLDR